MAFKIDHLMWGAPDLETGIEKAQELFGVTAAPGGSHPGLGTCNALLSLGDDVYLEIIAPDPSQQLKNTFGGRLQKMQQCQLITWAVAANPLEQVASNARSAGLSSMGPLETKRATAEGKLLSWELLFLGGHSYQNLIPFFIDWRNTHHPALTNPSAGRFLQIRLSSPRADELRELFEKMNVAISVVSADIAAISVDIESANGIVTLETSESTVNMKMT